MGADTTPDRISLNDFIAQHGITADVQYGAPADTRTIGERMTPWSVAIESTEGAFLVVPFFTGEAGGVPTARDVLECLALDAAGYENARHFEDWADEYGYDTDSRSAEQTYRAVETQSVNLRAQLGQTAYEQLLWNVDVD